MVEDREVLREVWGGRIPACFTFANDSPDSGDSFGATAEADPFYVMLPRLSYLTLVTDKVRKHFNKLLMQSPGEEEMWFSDGSSGTPLKWHLPVGVLFDQRAIGIDTTTDEDGGQLPWKINVHFGNFPNTQLIRFDSRELMESHFMSCIKEADQIKHGGRVVSAMQKKDHNQLWQGLQNDKFDQFWAVNRRLMDSKTSTAVGSGESANSPASTFKHIPVRLYLCNQSCDEESAPTHPMLQRLIKPVVKSHPESVDQVGDEETDPESQLRQATLKDLLTEMVPHKSLEEVKIITQGISPELDTPLQWMSEHLSYPDNFLHICVR